MKKPLSLLLAFALFSTILSATIRDNIQDKVEDKICDGMTEEQCLQYINGIKDGINDSVHGNGSAMQELNQTSQQAAEEAVQQSIENSISSMPLPQGTSIQVNDVTVTPTTIGAQTVIMISGKYGGSASVPVNITMSESGAMTATASCPTVNLPPGVPITVSPNENIKAASATLVVQTSPDTAQPISSVSVAVESPATGAKQVTLNKVENGVTIESENISVFTTATIKVEDETLYVETPTSSYSIVLPEDIEELSGQDISSAMLSMQNGTPIYNVNATQASNFLWLIPMAYPVESTINAQTGAVQSTVAPWWVTWFGMLLTDKQA